MAGEGIPISGNFPALFIFFWFADKQNSIKQRLKIQTRYTAPTQGSNVFIEAVST